MGAEALGTITIVLLGIAGAVLLALNLQGRALCRLLEQRHPEEYERLGLPMPGFLTTASRHRFFELIMQRKYRELTDPILRQKFADHRLRWLLWCCATCAAFVAVVVAFVWARHAA